MNTRPIPGNRMARIAAAMLLIFPAFSAAQVPVDEAGNVIGSYEPAASDSVQAGDEGIPRQSPTELEELVGPIALYPDDLLAIVLPASAYPLQIVAAGRFLDAQETDPSLEPDSDWDDSIVALTNYPEAVELLNKDLDWTYRLGEAVVAQQSEVIAAVESFRDRAYASGNLKSDAYQTVSNDEGVIEISPASEDVIYVPYYEPERVVVYQARPAYYYHPRPYPVYYYPYASNHYFNRGRFWGVTTAFSIGWYSDSLNVYHHSYHGHPYYGRSYRDNWWYRRPSINIYNNHYAYNSYGNVKRRYSHGDRWRASRNRRQHVIREGYARSERRRSRATASRNRAQQQIRFRQRENRPVARNRNARSQDSSARTRVRQNRAQQERRAETRTRVARSDARQRRAATTRPRESRRRQEQQPRQQRNARQRDANSGSSARRQQPVVAQTRRQQPAARSRDTQRQRGAQQSRQQRPAAVRRATPRRQDSQRSETRRREQPRQQRETRQRDAGSGSSARPQRRSGERRSNRRPAAQRR